MSHQEVHNPEPPVTFYDVAACFSEEEWKLFHKWQKELYQNVMTELHQSVISLGPLIAASVFSLKPKEEEGNGYMDSERKYNINHSKSETLVNFNAAFKEKRHEDQELKDSLDTDGRPSLTSENDLGIQEQLEVHLIKYSDVKGREFTNNPGSGPVDEDVFTVADTSLKIKYEVDQYPKTHQNSERKESLNPLRGFSVLTSDNALTRGQEMNVNVLDTQKTQQGESCTNTSSDCAPTDSFRCKEEKNTAYVNPQDPERTKNPTPCSMVPLQGALTCSGAECLQPTWGFPFLSCGLEVKAWDQNGTEGQESLSGPGSGPSNKTRGGPLHHVSEEVCSMNKPHSESWEYTSSPTGNSTSLAYTKQEARNWQRTCKQSECGRNGSPNLNQIRQPRILHGEEVYEYADYDSSFSQRSHHVEHQDDHPIHRTDESDCGKSSSESANLSKQHKIQTGVKLFICNQCGNNFSQSVNANLQHPSTCSECDRRLSQSASQNKSRRKRTGKTSHVCRECGKICKHSQALILHQRVHTGEKPHACGECGRCFSVMANLSRHRRIHTGEKPYTCSLCVKNFRQLPHLIKHQRIHMREEMLILGSRAIP